MRPSESATSSSSRWDLFNARIDRLTGQIRLVCDYFNGVEIIMKDLHQKGTV